MTSKKPGIAAKQPKVALFKPIKVDWGNFFKGLGKAIGSGIGQRIDGVVSGLVDSLCALSLTTEPGELAFRLVHRSLAQALVDLVDHTRTRFVAIPDRGPDTLTDLLEKQLSKLEFDLDQRFFDRPETFEGLKEILPLFTMWLKWQGLDHAEAEAVGRRLPSYFVYSLQEEWRSDLTGYRILADTVDTKFTKATERDWAWRRYAALLNRRTGESIFDEPFGLRDIYIPLRAYYLLESKKNDSAENTERMIGRSENRRRLAFDARQELDRWLNKRDICDALRVISGGPGSGKSSFARICAADWATEGRHVLFIPLHLIDASRDIIQQVGTCIEMELGYNPLEAKAAEPDLIVIFDGLDELSHQGKAAAETARAFVREVEKLVQLRNFHDLKLRVILSGREVVVQETESEFRREGEVLSLLPYYIPGNHSSETWQEPREILKQDQRQIWWNKFAKLTGRDWNGLPKDLQRADLDDVTAQPLLNYLVAQSYVRGRLNFTRGDINLNEIYADLVQAVHERGYERSRRHASIPNLSLEDFFRVLEEVALATWHGDSRSTTVREITEHCKRSGMETLLQQFTEGAESGVTNLLAAFFFRRQGQRDSGDRTFVFTHKSFGEYLTARRFVRGIDEASEERHRRRTRGYGGWDENDALTKWALICGPSAVTHELLRFIRAEVELRHMADVERWQEEFSALFRHGLMVGIPKEAVICSTFRESCIWGRNVSEALLVAVNACGLKTHRLSKVISNDSTAFATWLRQVQPQRHAPESSISFYCLSFLDLRGQSLFGCDLYGADLHSSDLSGSYLSWAWLDHANLTEAKFTRAVFDKANLYRTNFTGTDLSGAHFMDISLKGTDWERSILKETLFVDVREVPGTLVTEWERQNGGKFNGTQMSTLKSIRDEQTLRKSKK